MSCRLWPEQTQGPYHRDVHLERRGITEDREGLPLRVALRLLAPSETFLRGCRRTDGRGMCAFDTIYPGWYSRRTVHIHLTVRLGDRDAVTQLYFPEEVTDQVFARPPYAGPTAEDGWDGGLTPETATRTSPAPAASLNAPRR